jgi:NAD(P)H dehydrogenase (quinone)
MSRAKTLVTGATGMTGSHTVQLLLKREHTVRAIAHSEDDVQCGFRSLEPRW